MTSFVPFAWPFAVGYLARGRLKAVALSSVAALEAAGFGAEQVAAWAPRCAAGRLRLFAVRDAASGRRVAHFALRCAAEARLWVVESHSFGPDALRSGLELMADVHAAYQARTRGKPHVPMGEQKAVRRLRSEMDREDRLAVAPA